MTTIFPVGVRLEGCATIPNIAISKKVPVRRHHDKALPLPLPLLLPLPLPLPLPVTNQHQTP